MRRCGFCGESGHYKSTCPKRQGERTSTIRGAALKILGRPALQSYSAPGAPLNAPHPPANAPTDAAFTRDTDGKIQRLPFAHNIFSAPLELPPAGRTDEEIAAAVRDANALMDRLQALQLPKLEGLRVLDQVAALYLRSTSADDLERSVLDGISIIVEYEEPAQPTHSWAE